MKQVPVKLIKGLLGIGAISSLIVFIGVSAFCKFVLDLDSLWSAIIGMFSGFGTITATWIIGRK